MPRIGLRMIKTAISVFLCLMFYIVLKLFEYIPGVDDNLAYNWYNPFFAGIATAYSIHATKEASIKQAENRCIASLIGGIVGILLVTIYEFLGGKWPNSSNINVDTLNFLLPYLLISISVLIVIVLGIKLKKQQAVFVSILTLLSVTVNPNVNVENWQYQFGINRILSTIIGVLIALAVNLFRLPHKYNNKNLLFCVGIEGMLPEKEKFKDFILYKLNYFYRIGVNITLFTTRTPVTFMNLLEDVKVKHPIVCMSGAALYDSIECKYLATEPIDLETSNRLRKLLSDNEITPFINMIKDDVLFSYTERLDNKGEVEYAKSKKNAGYNCFIIDVAPMEEVLYFMIIDTEKKALEIINLIKKDEFLKDKLTILIYDNFENSYEGLKYIKIYSKKIEELNLLHEYLKTNNLELVGLTSSNYSNHLLKNSKYALTLKTVDEETKQISTEIINSNNPDALFKKANKIYNKNLLKYRK